MFFKCFLRGLYLWKIKIVTVLLFLQSSTGKPNFSPVNTCIDIKLKDIPLDVFQNCSTTNSAIHCLPDENNNLGLSCFPVTWISKDKCPSYNSYQGNMDEKDCSTDHNGTCPIALYKSPLSIIYTGCYIKELIPPPTTKSMTTETMTTTTSKKSSSDPITNDSGVAEKRNETCQKCVECGDGWKIAFVVTFLLVVLAVFVVAIILKNPFCPELKEKIRQEFFQDQQDQPNQNDSPPAEEQVMLGTCNGGNH